MSRPTRFQRLLIAAHPPSFRGRYGAEFTGLVADSGASPRIALDLMVSVLRAWLRPIAHGDPAGRRRWRLEATTATVFVAWCLALIAIGGFSRGVDDSALPGLASVPASTFFAIAEAAFTVSLMVIAAGALFYTTAVLVPAIRRGQRSVWLPVVVPIAAGVAWLAISAGAATLLHRYGGSGSDLPQTHPVLLGVIVSLVLLWLAMGGCCLLGCAFGGPVALRRAQLSPPLLLPGAIGALIIACATTVSGVCALLCVLSLRGRNPLSDLLMPGIGAALLLASATAAVTSAVRCVPTLLSIPRAIAGSRR